MMYRDVHSSFFLVQFIFIIWFHFYMRYKDTNPSYSSYSIEDSYLSITPSYALHDTHQVKTDVPLLTKSRAWITCTSFMFLDFVLARFIGTYWIISRETRHDITTKVSIAFQLLTYIIGLPINIHILKDLDHTLGTSLEPVGGFCMETAHCLNLLQYDQYNRYE